MRVASSPTSVSLLASRCMAGSAFLFDGVLPVAGQSSGGSTTKPAGQASSTAKKKPAQKTKKPGQIRRKAGRKSPQVRPANGNQKAASPAVKAARRARTARIKLAFVASTELRPMAQQLATMRTPAAYAGVTKYAHQHTGEAAAAAYLALGHAYLLDNRYGEAIANFRLARQAGAELADYADFLDARANHNVGNEETAEALLHGFTVRYPESIFVAEAPELEAETLLA
jgi:soluble lytic murein transglycosylase